MSTAHVLDVPTGPDGVARCSWRPNDDGHVLASGSPPRWIRRNGEPSRPADRVLRGFALASGVGFDPGSCAAAGRRGHRAGRDRHAGRHPGPGSSRRRRAGRPGRAEPAPASDGARTHRLRRSRAGRHGPVLGELRHGGGYSRATGQRRCRYDRGTWHRRSRVGGLLLAARQRDPGADPDGGATHRRRPRSIGRAADVRRRGGSSRPSRHRGECSRAQAPRCRTTIRSPPLIWLTD